MGVNGRSSASEVISAGSQYNLQLRARSIRLNGSVVTRGAWKQKALGSIPGGALILPFDFLNIRPFFLSSTVSHGHDRLQWTTGVVITGLLKLLVCEMW